MDNNSFIDQILRRGKESKQKAQAEFSLLSQDQLNWKPGANSWSIGECLEHLIVSNRIYFDVLSNIAKGQYIMSVKEKFSPLTYLWGLAMKDAMKEHVSRKMRTHKTLTPVKSNFNTDQLDNYIKNCNTLFEHIAHCRDVNLTKTVITSPVLWFVTYNLRDVFTFLSTHQLRHINQGIRLKSMSGFPSN